MRHYPNYVRHDDRKKLQLRLREISGLIQQNIGVSVGFFADGNSYSSGVAVADVAQYQEYGTARSDNWGPIPPRPFMRPAYDENKGKWIEYLRSALIKELKKGKRGNLRKPFENLGSLIQSDIVEAIHAVTSPPLSPTTLKLRAKKRGLTQKRINGMDAATYANFAKPLEDTGKMVSAVSYKVTTGGAK